MQTEKVIKRDNKYVLHTYARSRVVLAEGHGMTAAALNAGAVSLLSAEL